VSRETDGTFLTRRSSKRLEIDTEDIGGHSLSHPFKQIATLVDLTDATPPATAALSGRQRANPAALSKDGGLYLNAEVGPPGLKPGPTD
jgi:hypothetical protein